MCGIAGFSGQFDKQLLARMSESIAHRGPDGDGLFHSQEQEIGLAHRRLAIIDPTEAGAQPMWDRDRNICIVFNGEVYNFQQLQKELVASGVQFKGHSDTEVLLYLYLRNGEEIFSYLNGIYALAIWDARSRMLIVARDGLGVKPLYYAQTAKGFLFASELKALLKHKDLSRDLDPVALGNHLSYLWSPAPGTILQSVKKLEPGMAMRVKDGKVIHHWQHYSLPVTRQQDSLTSITADEAAEEVRATLRMVVQKQLVSDVPLGAFLSGGLDSSAIVALAKEAQPDKDLKCFTISVDDDAFRKEGVASDLPYAEKVAGHLGVDLHTVHVGPEMADELSTMIYHLDEPQADPAPLNVLFISRLARQHGIKVLLSGAGGDDIFTGYRRHRALLLEKYWSWLPHSIRKLIAQGANALPARPSIFRQLGKGLRYADLDGDARVASYFNWLAPDMVDTILTDNWNDQYRGSNSLVKVLSGLPDDIHPLNRMLYLECQHYLPDHNLNYTDKMSMAAGVEVRVPLLDTDLVNLAFRLPPRFKQHGATGKWIFKRAMEGILPQDVIYRPKTGFGVPLRSWLHGPLKNLLGDTLSASSLRGRGLFNPGALQNLVKMDRDGKLDASYPIFAALCVELWCQRFIDGTT